MLELKHIDKSFHKGTVNENQLFKDFNLTIAKGDFVSIIGSNGSGKSTLLNLVCGSLSQDGGEIWMEGQRVDPLRDHQRYKRMGRVFQDPAMGTSPSMTLLENLSMADNKNQSWGLRRGVNRDRLAAYRDLLAPLGLGLENKLHDKVGGLSGGQRQAVALLMATLTPIDFLILDEHTAALDPKTANIIMDLTDKIVRDKGLTALMVTHNLQHSLTYGNRILMMHEGQVILDKRDQAKKNLVLDEVLDQFYEISIEAGNSI
ncbi:MAG: ATP-binding cassette domain-containing protein [Tissierellia bacterium]|nr:ATP-binding cassette domain-containing protein [Tissierellia bacterium]